MEIEMGLLPELPELPSPNEERMNRMNFLLGIDNRLTQSI